MGTFRPIAEAERVRHQRITDHVWGEGGVPDYDGPAAVPEALGERWAYVEDGDLCSICTLLELDVQLAGAWRPVGAIRGFVTPPEHRGAGYGRALQRAALAEFAERGLPYAVLWPESIDYYRRHGWGLVHTETEYAFPPEAMADPGVAGTFDRVDADDWERLDGVWRDYAGAYELALRRDGDWWRERVLDDAWAYCWTPDESDAPAGYVVSTIDRDERVLTVEELAYRTERARAQLLGFLDRHGPQADRVEWACPEERRLLFGADDPDAVSASIDPGASGRVVDVPAAIEALPSDRSPSDSVTVAVTDPLRSANEGLFRVEPGPTCTPLDGDATPDVTVDSSVLARLYAGTCSVRTAARREEVAATDEAVAALESTFGARDVYVSDFF